MQQEIPTSSEIIRQDSGANEPFIGPVLSDVVQVEPLQDLPKRPITPRIPMSDEVINRLIERNNNAGMGLPDPVRRGW